jgi:hypothetical protein
MSQASIVGIHEQIVVADLHATTLEESVETSNRTMDEVISRWTAWLNHLSILANFVSTSISDYGCVLSRRASKNLALSFSHLVLLNNQCYDENACAL